MKHLHNARVGLGASIPAAIVVSLVDPHAPLEQLRIGLGLWQRSLEQNTHTVPDMCLERLERAGGFAQLRKRRIGCVGYVL